VANLVKQFVNHFGLDLKSSDIVREPQFASDMLNAEYRKNGNISKRVGYRGTACESGGAGLAVYNRIDPTTAAEQEILIAISEKLEVLQENTITLSYSGAELSVVLELFFDPSADEYKCQIVENTTLVLDFSLGKGIDEATPVTLSDLKTAIDALANFSATIVGDTASPAAFLELARGINLAEGDHTLSNHCWNDANQPLASLLPGNVTFKDDADFENTSWVQLNNVIYFSNGYDEVIKYDGQNAYKAGLPKPAQPTAALSGAGNPNGTYTYRLAYYQFDAAGNIAEGNGSDTSGSLVSTNQSIDVTVSNIQASSGFNTNCAIVAGAQGPVNTITVDDGSGGNHTMKVGDTAYFFDSVSGDYVEREVTATGVGTITVAGAAVTVADNAVISNNLRIGIFRTANSGSTHFLVAEIPNDSFTTTQVYNDNVADANLGIELLIPIFSNDLPPKGRYIASYNNQLFISGNLDNPNLAYFSDVGKPESFYLAIGNLRLQSPNGDKITGLKQNNEVMAVFERRAIHIITGDIPNLLIRVETITKDVGCASHGTIQEVRGQLYFLSDRGVYSLVSGQLPKEISTRVEPLFDISSTVDDPELVPILKRAIAVNHREKEQYIVFIPAESQLAGANYANDFSVVVTQDYYRGAWLKWDNMNMAAGAVIFNDRLFFSEKRNSVAFGRIANYLYSQNNRGDAWDYNDDTEPTFFSYSSAWYHLNEPSVFKKYNRFKLFGSEDTDFNQYLVNISIEKDFLDDSVIGQFDIDFTDNGFGYGVSAYGVSPYGDVTDPNRKHKIGPIKAKAIRFVIDNNEPLQNVDVTGWELELNAPYRTMIKE